MLKTHIFDLLIHKGVIKINMEKDRVIFEIDLPIEIHKKLKSKFLSRKMKDGIRSIIISVIEEEIQAPEKVLKFMKKNKKQNHGRY